MKIAHFKAVWHQEMQVGRFAEAELRAKCRFRTYSALRDEEMFMVEFTITHII